MNIDSIEKGEIYPINPPSKGIYSFKDGAMMIQFNIANQDKLLNGTSLRLNGDITLLRPDGATLPDNATAGVAEGNGISLNPKIGVYACISQLTLSSQSNQTLETIRNYGRYLASSMPIGSSSSDFDTLRQQGNVACSSKSFNSARALNKKCAFSVPLKSGLLGSQPIPLGQNGIRGMLINLELSPDSNAICGYIANNNTRQTFTPIDSGASYQLSNLSLSYDLLIPDGEGSRKLSTPATGQFIYNSISSLYGVLNSSDQTHNLNLGTSNTISVSHNFIPTTQINNYSHDSYSTDRLKTGADYADVANINKVSFIRGSQKFPLDYTIDEESEALTNRPQTEIDQRFIDSLRPFDSVVDSLVSVFTNNQVNTNIQFTRDDTPTRPLTLPDKIPIYGVGIRFDPISNVGINFQNTNYAVRIESELQGVSPNSMYTFVNSKNRLTYSPNGIVVSN